uniref:Uncharacterized protein n=1 Tax=Trichobilharzia regenti TaxID=157069 RepID=A0AA85JM15_TRIRE|nr:unnamed protein product [Trichobilharzia regenti]
MCEICVYETPVNSDTSHQKYCKHFRQVRISKRQITKSRIIYILNVFAIIVFQLWITFGMTSLITQQLKISLWVTNHTKFLYVISAIYFVMEFVWAFVKTVSKVFPWNLLYLIVTTLLCSFIIATESLEYTDDVPFIAFAFMWTMLQVIVSFAIFIFNDFTVSVLTRVAHVVFAVTISAGQIAFFLRRENKVALVVAGSIGFPCTCYLIVKEVKSVFGKGTYFYPEDNIVLPARNIYGYCWSLYLVILWVYAYSGLRNPIYPTL